MKKFSTTVMMERLASSDDDALKYLNSWEQPIDLTILASRIEVKASEDYYGTNLLLYACQQGATQTVTALLDTQAFDIQKTDDNGHNALWHALSTGNYDIAEILMQQGLTSMSTEALSEWVTSIPQDAPSLLMKAFTAKADSVIYFLQEQAEENTEFKEHCVITELELLELMQQEKINFDEACLLLEEYTKPTATYDTRTAPMFWQLLCEALNNEEDSEIAMSLRSMQDLIQRVPFGVELFNQPIDMTEDMTTTLLIQACTHNQESLVQLLLNQGIELNTLDSKGHSALWHALDKQNLNVANCLIQHGASLDSSFQRSEILKSALQTQNYDLAMLLYDQGVSLDHGELQRLLTSKKLGVDQQGHTLLWHVLSQGQDEIGKEYLSSLTMTSAELIDLITRDKLTFEKIISWLETNPDLISDLPSHNKEVVEAVWALAYKTLVQQMQRDINSPDALQTFQSFMDIFNTKHLDLELSRDIQLPDNENTTLLIYLCQQGNLLFVEVFLDREVQLGATDSEGYSALWHALAHQHFAAANLLIERGLTIDYEDLATAFPDITAELLKNLFIQSVQNQQLALADFWVQQELWDTKTFIDELSLELEQAIDEHNLLWHALTHQKFALADSFIQLGLSLDPSSLELLISDVEPEMLNMMFWEALSNQQWALANFFIQQGIIPDTTGFSQILEQAIDEHNLLWHALNTQNFSLAFFLISEQLTLKPAEWLELSEEGMLDVDRDNHSFLWHILNTGQFDCINMLINIEEILEQSLEIQIGSDEFINLIQNDRLTIEKIQILLSRKDIIADLNDCQHDVAKALWPLLELHIINMLQKNEDPKDLLKHFKHIHFDHDLLVHKIKIGDRLTTLHDYANEKGQVRFAEYLQVLIGEPLTISHFLKHIKERITEPHDLVVLLQKNLVTGPMSTMDNHSILDHMFVAASKDGPEFADIYEPLIQELMSHGAQLTSTEVLSLDVDHPGVVWAKNASVWQQTLDSLNKTHSSHYSRLGFTNPNQAIIDALKQLQKDFELGCRNRVGFDRMATSCEESINTLSELIGEKLQAQGFILHKKTFTDLQSHLNELLSYDLDAGLSISGKFHPSGV